MNDYRKDPPPPGRKPSASELNWYVFNGRKELGPFSSAALIEMAAVKEIEATDFVRQGGGAWTKACDLVFLRFALVQNRVPHPPESGENSGVPDLNAGRTAAHQKKFDAALLPPRLKRLYDKARLMKRQIMGKVLAKKKQLSMTRAISGMPMSGPFSSAVPQGNSTPATNINQSPARATVDANNPLMQYATWVPQLIAILLLLWAFNRSNGYGYYVLLRWVCCLIFGSLTLFALAQKKGGLACVLAVTAVVYNPVLRLHLDRGTWTTINLISIGIAVGSILAFKRPDSKPPGKKH